MASTIKLRRGTASEWTSANPTLSTGEFGYETDTSKLKIGDGSTSWTSLDYFIDPTAGTALSDLTDVSDSGATTGQVLTKQSSGYAFETPFDGSYNSLTNTPTLFDGAFSSLTGTPTTLSGYGITDAFDGAYSSLTGTPTIPSNLSDLSDISDSGATTGQVLTRQADNSYAFETVSASVSNLSDLSDVSTSGANTGDVLTRQSDNSYAFESPSSSSASIYHNTYVYEASSGQTNFTGADDDGYTLSFSDDQTMVFLNGVMLVKTTDYSEDSDLAGITLVESANVGDIILISTWEGTQKS